jgi:hypothetical protein
MFKSFVEMRNIVEATFKANIRNAHIGVQQFAGVVYSEFVEEVRKSHVCHFFEIPTK